MPVAWHFHLTEGPDGQQISPDLLADLEPVLKRAIERKLLFIIDWHHFEDLNHDPAKHQNRFIGGWKAIARQFKSWPTGLFFELLNEPCEKLTTEAVNPIYQETIAAVRAIDAKRMIVVSPGSWGDLGESGALNTADHASRACYLKDVRTLAEERKIPWTLWEWKSGFGYWDPETNRPLFGSSLME